ncbi:MAG: hypothetical protein ABIM49_03865 [candidate division WOR-3 bacterium]
MKELEGKIREVVEEINKIREEKMRERLFKKAIKYLKEIPYIKGKHVQTTGNDFFGRSWEQGFLVSYSQNGEKWIRLRANANVSYEVFFPYSDWYEKTNKNVAEQLFELYSDGDINLDTIIKFEWIDWEKKTYDNSEEIELKFSEIVDEVIKIMKNKVEKEND